MLKTFLPQSITLPDGTVLDKRTHYILGVGPSLGQLLERAKQRGARYRLVEVLERNLRGKNGLDGLSYTPSTWILSDKDLRVP
jgi:hypothetical protein